MDAVTRRDALRAGVATTVLLGGVGATGGVAEASNDSGRALAAPGATDGWISVLDHGAIGDGQADDTAAIQRALDAARAASGPSKGVHFPPGKTYRVTDQLVASGLTDFVLSGYGAVLALTRPAAAQSGTKSVLHLTNCRRFRVLGLALADTDRSQQYNGIRISSSSEGVVDGVVVRDVTWTGITVFDAAPRASSNIVVTNCTVKGTRFGIATNGKDVRIIDNHVAMDWPATAEGLAKGGVWSEPSRYYDGIMVLSGADRTVVGNNTITECGQAGVYTQACTNLVVSDNTVVGCRGRGIEVDGDTGVAAGVSITGNVVTGCHGHVNLVRARDVTVVGNRIENPQSGRDVSCIAVNVGTSKVVVVGNTARQAHPTKPAIFVDPASTDVTVAWNDVQASVPYQTPADTVRMYRSGPGQIKTDGKLIAAGGIGVGNSAPASRPGPVVRKIEVFSSTGASLGWLPVYGSIT